jgi:segregation and condensation protein A
MSESFADNAIALLIDLAQRGEIDPWNVDVVDVFDRFLSDLPLTSSQDLATSGQAFLYASMLILLKAETLAGFDPPEEAIEEAFDAFGEGLDWGTAPLPFNLEQHLHRRPVALPFPKRRVTLGELIQQLELISVAVDRQSRQLRPRKAVRPSKIQAAKAIAQLSHPENLAEVATEVEQILQSHPAEDWISFETFLTLKNDRVGLFWALLLLSAQSKIELEQESFYGGLRLRLLPNETPRLPTHVIEVPRLEELNPAAS